eukprot:768476-Hanusia_phi.AAC.2
MAGAGEREERLRAQHLQRCPFRVLERRRRRGGEEEVKFLRSCLRQLSASGLVVHGSAGVQRRASDDWDRVNDVTCHNELELEHETLFPIHLH